MLLVCAVGNSSLLFLTAVIPQISRQQWILRHALLCVLSGRACFRRLESLATMLVNDCTDSSFSVPCAVFTSPSHPSSGTLLTRARTRCHTPVSSQHAASQAQQSLAIIYFDKRRESTTSTITFFDGVREDPGWMPRMMAPFSNTLCVKSTSPTTENGYENYVFTA